MSILTKDTIKEMIVPYLRISDKGPQIPDYKLVAIIQLILYRLKTGCQWRELPMGEFLSEPYTYQSVFHHYNKWCKQGCWQDVWQALVANNKHLLDLSSAQLDGSHTPARCGGEAVSYQKRKARNTTNSIVISDANGILIASSRPVEGSRHDVAGFEENMAHIASMTDTMGISLDGLFLNADAGFDTEEVRRVLGSYGIEVNIAQNQRNGNAHLERDDYFDQMLYQARFAIERAFAWLDSFKALMTRYEKKAQNWFSLNVLGFAAILQRKITSSLL